MKLAIITCYRDPDYVRARSLRAAVQQIEGVEMYEIKNSYTGLARYFQVAWRLLNLKLSVRPDAYLLTFRGYEMLPIIALMAGRKPILFDEFVNPVEWLFHERYPHLVDGRIYRIVRWFYRRLVHRSSRVLCDTPEHAKLIAQLDGLPADRVYDIPVGTDETLFNTKTPYDPPDRRCRVFFYSNMLPLHGLTVVLEAAELLSNEPGIEFHIVGGGREVAHTVNEAKLPHVLYESWVAFTRLPDVMKTSTLFLAGPFGGTFQAQRIITGKAMQAMACGVPVVVGQNVATRMLHNKRNALVVQQADPMALAEAIKWAAQHPRELHSIGSQGRICYERYFSNVIIRRRLEQLLHEAA